jgi:hypothetical protein
VVSLREAVLVISLLAIAAGIWLVALALWLTSRPVSVEAAEERTEDGAAEVIEAEPVAVVESAPKPVEHVGTDEDPEAFIAELAEATALMQVKDDLAQPLDLDVVIALDRLQGEAYGEFAAGIDAALAGFKVYPVEAHEETTDEFLHRAELSAWSSALTGSFKTISLSSDTQEITREQIAAVLGGAK